nr:homoserine kinase [Ipomoea trifida]
MWDLLEKDEEMSLLKKDEMGLLKKMITEMRVRKKSPVAKLYKTSNFPESDIVSNTSFFINDGLPLTSSSLTLSDPKLVSASIKFFTPTAVANLGLDFDFLGCTVVGTALIPTFLPDKSVKERYPNLNKTKMERGGEGGGEGATVCDLGWMRILELMAIKVEEKGFDITPPDRWGGGMADEEEGGELSERNLITLRQERDRDPAFS